MQPLSGNQRPDLLTALMHMSLVLRLPRKTHLCRSASNAPRLPAFLEMPQNPHVFLLTRCTIPCACHAKRHLTVQKWSGRACGAFNILTSKCASRHNGVHFFDISTSKSGPSMVCFVHFDFEMCFAPATACTFSTSQLVKSCPKLVCFVHFDFEMCFAPKRRALFRHRNFKKCSGREVFLAFQLANVLRATTACNFSSLIWPAGSAPAALASLLFDPPEPQIIGKKVICGFPNFSRTWIFFLRRLSLFDLLSSSLLFSDSSHLCFSICPYCRKFDF